MNTLQDLRETNSGECACNPCRCADCACGSVTAVSKGVDYAPCAGGENCACDE